MLPISFQERGSLLANLKYRRGNTSTMQELSIDCLNGHTDSYSGISANKYLKKRMPANDPVPTFAAPMHFNTGCGDVTAEQNTSVKRWRNLYRSPFPYGDR